MAVETNIVEAKPILGANEHEIIWQGKKRVLKFVWWKTEEILSLIFSTFMELTSNPTNLLKFLNLSEADKVRIKKLTQEINAAKDNEVIAEMQKKVKRILDKAGDVSQININDATMKIIKENINKIIAICLSEKDKDGNDIDVVTENEIKFTGRTKEVLAVTGIILTEIGEIIKNAPQVIEKGREVLQMFSKEEQAKTVS